MKKLNAICMVCVLAAVFIVSPVFAQEKCAGSKAVPENNIKNLKVCSGCGEIMGNTKCCKQGAQKCPKCNLNKGSIGCCKNIPANASICAKCGEIKGTDKCCLKNAQKCSKCALIKGSPGCCKIL